MSLRPKIAVTTRLELETRRFYLGRDYAEAIAASGGVPLHLGLIPDDGYVMEALSGVDGVLLPGSNTDMDPQYYAEEPHPRLGTVVPEKDRTELLVLAEAERRGLPVFGICFGMQAINVSRGGSLIQDIPSMVDNCLKHDQGIPYDRASHAIRFEADSLLSGIVRSQDDSRGRVNSSHHQAVKKIGANLRATSWASDGVVESIEDTRPGRIVLGVQWHPELTFAQDRLSRGLFEWFVSECAKFACGQNKESAAGVF